MASWHSLRLRLSLLLSLSSHNANQSTNNGIRRLQEIAGHQSSWFGLITSAGVSLRAISSQKSLADITLAGYLRLSRPYSYGTSK